MEDIDRRPNGFRHVWRYIDINDMEPSAVCVVALGR